MQITEEQYRQIRTCLPRPAGNVSLSNLEVINAFSTWPSRAVNGAVYRGDWLLAHDLHPHEPLEQSGGFGPSFRASAARQIMRIKIEAVSLGSTSSRCIPMAPGL